MAWTKEQETAIYKDGTNIIVSAGAGSGKTAVLTERVLEKVKNGISVDNLLILTFTKMAAKEMRERIGDKLKKAGLTSELSKLDTADITTFDAYALSLVKKYHYYLNVSKDISIIDASVITLYKRKVLKDIFNELYEKEDSKFLSLIKEYSIKDDKEIFDFILNINNKLDLKTNKREYLDKIRESVISVEKIKDVDYILEHFNDSQFISNAYISELDASTGTITINLESTNELYKETLKSIMGDTVTTKAGLLKMFASYTENKEEMDSIKEAIKMTNATGYGIVYPHLKELKLETPELVKQGSRYGVKLKAVASSIHMIKVDVESTFEPIIGSELQSKELINHLMKDYENDSASIWKSEIFGRSLETIVQEGIQAKLNMMPDNTRFKLKETVSKIVNKGSNTLIAIVI